MPEPERPSLVLPAELNRRADELLSGAGWVAPAARDAATVALLRDRGGAVEVLLQRRPGSMAFAGGMHVFPGGRVEDADADEAVPWRGPDDYEPFPLPAGAGPTARFRALTVAAVRETWEEAGVALVRAEPAVALPPSDADIVAWLAEHGGAVAGDALFPWVHWITPEVETRRFDTRFLVAALPAGAEAVDFGVETDRTHWISPAAALDRLRRGDMPMLPPTADALEQLADYRSVAAVLADARQRRPRPYLPRPYRSGSGIGWRIVDAYTGTVIAE